jgi:putative cardiolipin synthase
VKYLLLFISILSFSISLNISAQVTSSPTEFRILESSEYLDKRLELIRSTPTNSEILISQFIFRIDNVGKLLIKELIKARRRGVRVKVIIDGVGEAPILSYSKEDYVALKQLGFEVKIFHPKHYLNKLRNRMHHKIFIANNQVILGSSSIYDLSMFYILEMDMLFKGKVVEESVKHFYEFWDSAEVEDRYAKIIYTGSKQQAVKYFLERLNNSESDFNISMEEMLNNISFDKTKIEKSFSLASKIKYVKDSPIKNPKANINKDILELIANAKQSVTIVTPYPYFPIVLKNVLMKLPWNVQIKIITSSQNAKSNEDPGLQKSYELQLPFFQKRKIEVFESNRFLHAKVVIVDSKNLFLGSHNLDYLGFYSNNENGVIITDFNNSTEFSKDLNSKISTYLSSSTQLIQNGIQRKGINLCEGIMCNMWRLYYPQMAQEHD